jgi:hypothetical protein
LLDRRSPIATFSASDRVSRPLRRSMLERLSFSRLLSTRIGASPWQFNHEYAALLNEP